MSAKDKLPDGIEEPVIRVTNGLTALAIMAALVAAVGLADPLIDFLNAELASLGDLGTVTNGLAIGLTALVISFLRNEATYSEFSRIQRVLYAVGTIVFLAVFMSSTVNGWASASVYTGTATVAGGIVYHYGVSAADVLGAKIGN